MADVLDPFDLVPKTKLQGPRLQAKTAIPPLEVKKQASNIKDHWEGLRAQNFNPQIPGMSDTPVRLDTKPFLATHYNPTDPNQTKGSADGVGAFNTPVQFGDVATGDRTHQQGQLITVPGLADVQTPYGKGVFKINDKKNARYNTGQDSFDFAIPDSTPNAQALRNRIGNNQFDFKLTTPQEQMNQVLPPAFPVPRPLSAGPLPAMPTPANPRAAEDASFKSGLEKTQVGKYLSGEGEFLKKLGGEAKQAVTQPKEFLKEVSQSPELKGFSPGATPEERKIAREKVSGTVLGSIDPASGEIKGGLEAVIQIGDKIYAGANHAEAIQKALDAGENVVGSRWDIGKFRTPDGQILTRAETKAKYGIDKSEDIPTLFGKPPAKTVPDPRKGEIPGMPKAPGATLGDKSFTPPVAPEIKFPKLPGETKPIPGVPPAPVGGALKKAQDVLKEGQNLIKQNEKKTIGQRLRGALTELYDKFQPLNKFMSDAEKKLGRPLTTDENAYVGARLYAGVGGKVQAKLGELKDILTTIPKGVSGTDFSSYLFLQRSIERASRGFANPGEITADVANQALKELETKLGPENYNKVTKMAGQIYQYGDSLLRQVKDAGIIDQASFDAIKAKNQMYVPFQVIEHMLEKGTVIPSGSKAFSVAAQDLIKTTKGTEKLVDDPINALIRKTIKTVDLIERNGVSSKVYALKDKLGSAAEGFIKDIAEGQSVEKGWEKIDFLKDGKKVSYAVPQEVGDALKRMNTKEVDIMTRGASWGSKALRSGATSLNAAFIVPNAIRDFETATLVSKYGFNPLDWAGGFWESSKATLGELGVKVDDKIFQDYMKSGANIGGYFSTYLNDVPRTAVDLTKPAWKKIAGLLNPLKLISTVGETIERAPRLGVFMKALSKGESTAGAAFASREATVDFSKMGETGRIYNMWVPFVNARLQGTVNIGKALARAAGSPKESAAIAAKIMALGVVPFAATYYNNIQKFPEVWSDLADYEKANNVILIYGNHKNENGIYDQVIKFPKGDMNFFIDPIQDVLEYTRGQQPNILKALALDTVGNLSPVNVASATSFGEAGQQLAGGLVPPPLKAALEGTTNQNLYTGLPIVPFSMQKASPEQQYKPFTPLLAKKVGDMLGISPLIIQNAVKTTLGGLGGQIMGLGGTVEKPGFTFTPATDVSARFSGARGGKQEKGIEGDVKKAQQDMYDKRLMTQRAAEKTWSSLKKASSDQEVIQILTDIKDDPAIKKDLKKLIKNEALGVTYSDKTLLSLPDADRAQYMVDRLDSFTSDEGALGFIREMKTKNILTDGVKQAMKDVLARQAAENAPPEQPQTMSDVLDTNQ